MTPPDTITAPQFQALCLLIFGPEWRPQAAHALGVGMRNVQFWAAEPPARSKPVPPGVVRDLFAMVAEDMRNPEAAGRMRNHVARHASQAEILELVTAPETSERPADR
jgi:hypothetical protein